MSPDRPTVVVSGSGGLLGSLLVPALLAAGYQVLGLQRSQVTPPEGESGLRVLPINLLDPTQIPRLRATVRDLVNIRAVVHLAAVAHGERTKIGVYRSNCGLTEGLYAVLGGDIHWIFASSVAVYGEANRTYPVKVGDELRPATAYARSKLDSERFLLERVRCLDILRLAPVYTPTALKDVSKRVFVPGTRIRMLIDPEPSYSLCTGRTAVDGILSAIGERNRGVHVHNICDSRAYGQHELAAMFSGAQLVVNRTYLRHFRLFLGGLPSPYSYQVACLYHKLFKTTTYTPGVIQVRAVPDL